MLNPKFSSKAEESKARFLLVTGCCAEKIADLFKVSVTEVEKLV